MKSILIRYTDSQYAKSYLTGDLYLSSLSRFWDLRPGITGQNDFSEGISAQLPNDVLSETLGKEFVEAFGQHLIHDARFRIEAYGYCNLLCFYRIDAIDTTGSVKIDTRYISLVKSNPLLNNRLKHVVQIPDDSMNNFGDTVIIVKDETKFIERVISAIKKIGGECVIGDVRYHRIKDRVDPSRLNRPHGTLISDEPMDIDMFCCGRDDIISYGSLDKYDVYKKQKEWRICWLSNERNNEPKWLHAGDMSDIIDIVPSSKIISKIQQLFPGYLMGYVEEVRRQCTGTMSYREFKNLIEGIDGKCRPLFEIG